MKTTAEWFPRRERAFATGIFNSGANVGAILAPLIVPIIAVTWGWQWAFIITGALGFIWLGFWYAIYSPPDEHKTLSAEERAYIHSDGAEPTERISWKRLLPHRETLTVCLLKFVTDPVWWFFLFWLPKFLHERFAVSLLDLGPPLVVIYAASDVGSVAGGWFSSHLIKRGWSIDAARKTSILAFGVLAIPIFWASHTTNLWTAIGLISLGTAAHQACSSNIYTIMSDVFPRRIVGSVVGLAGFFGAISGALIAEFVGFVLHVHRQLHAHLRHVQLRLRGGLDHTEDRDPGDSADRAVADSLSVVPYRFTWPCTRSAHRTPPCGRRHHL